MTKYFKVHAVIQKDIFFSLAAEDEHSARVVARNLATQKGDHGGTISKLVLTPDGETEFKVGDQIWHAKFGAGKILDMSSTTNWQDEMLWFATIDFASGSRKEICLSLPKEMLQLAYS